MTAHGGLRHRTVVDVDSRGRVSLARFGIKSTQLVVEQLEDGGVVLHPAVVLTPAEARHYRDPRAIAALDEALAAVHRGDPRPMTLRSEDTTS
jgi:hypothetical protein